MTLFLSFDNDHRADHLGRRSYVQVEGLAIYGWCENEGVSERCLQPVEGFLSLGGPREALGFPQDSIRGKPFSPRREMNRMRDARHPMTLYTPFRSWIGPIRVMAETFSGLGSMPSWEIMKPKSMPRGTPNTHFSGLSFTPL